MRPLIGSNVPGPAAARPTGKRFGEKGGGRRWAMRPEGDRRRMNEEQTTYLRRRYSGTLLYRPAASMHH